MSSAKALGQNLKWPAEKGLSKANVAGWRDVKGESKPCWAVQARVRACIHFLGLQYTLSQSGELDV